MSKRGVGLKKDQGMITLTVTVPERELDIIVQALRSLPEEFRDEALRIAMEAEPGIIPAN